MPTYKAFWIDSRTNLVRSETIKASDDDQVLALASKFQRGVRQEIWEGERYVGAIELNGTRHRPVTAKRKVA